MDYQKWGETALQKITLRHGTSTTAVWCDAPSSKPVAIFIHGLSGDHFGLVPLAYELSGHYQIAIVELPGHGDSDQIPLPDVASLQRWFMATLDSIIQQIGEPALICTHSFASLAVLNEKILAKYSTILLNPVPIPSQSYIRYAKCVMWSSWVWAYWYSWRISVYIRGRIVTRIHTDAAQERVNWVGRHARTTYRQAIYQARLIDMALDVSAYQYASDGQVTLVVCGKNDMIPAEYTQQSMRTIFGSTTMIFVEGGHILPIESPSVVAQIIKSSMVH